MLVSLSAFSADLGLLGCRPPTTVNWAPRRIALGSKFDIEIMSSFRKSQCKLCQLQVKLAARVVLIINYENGPRRKDWKYYEYSASFCQATIYTRGIQTRDTNEI